MWLWSRREVEVPAGPRRRLFLDDDPDRAALFLTEYPDAVWVTTVTECIEQLQSPWDEVHLDHDLGGEQYVDTSRDDCGMEVIRWLGLEPRRHLKSALFTVHSHNSIAAYMMTLQLKSMGLHAQIKPFGLGAWKALPPRPPTLRDRLRAWLGLSTTEGRAGG